MTMNGHGISGGEHGGMNAVDLMVPGAGRSGLDRRRLLGGLVAGAAGLLLPRSGATAQDVTGPGPRGTKLIRFEVFNREWADNVFLETFWPRYLPNVERRDYFNWFMREREPLLKRGETKAFEGHTLFRSPPPNPFDYIEDSKFAPQFLIEIMGSGVWAENRLLGTPSVKLLFGSQPQAELEVGQTMSEAVPRTVRSIKVTRKDDTDAFKEYLVELVVIGKEADIRPGAKNDNNDNDKKDKNNKDDNTKRQRKRGGGGGLSDVDQRQHPVDRLLD